MAGFFVLRGWVQLFVFFSCPLKFNLFSTEKKNALHSGGHKNRDLKKLTATPQGQWKRWICAVGTALAVPVRSGWGH